MEKISFVSLAEIEKENEKEELLKSLEIIKPFFNNGEKMILDIVKRKIKNDDEFAKKFIEFTESIQSNIIDIDLINDITCDILFDVEIDGTVN